MEVIAEEVTGWGIAKSYYRRTYSGKRKYEQFGREMGAQILPAMEQRLFLLGGRSLWHAIVRIYLAGVHHLLIVKGSGDPNA